jgi:membrane protein YqaA with SNARE-associated domain
MKRIAEFTKTTLIGPVAGGLTGYIIGEKKKTQAQ